MEKPQMIFYPQAESSNHITIYYCGWEQCSAGYQFGPAVRNHYLVHYVSRGQGSYQIKGKKEPVRAGQLFLIPPFEPATYQADEQHPWEYYWIGFDGGESQELLEQIGFGEGQYVMAAANPKAVTDCMYQMSSMYTQETPSRCMLTSLLYRLFDELMPARQKTDRNGYVASAIQYIYNNYAYPITIAEIARQVGINRSYLYNLFMEERGISPQQYLIHHRLSVACEMLKIGRYSVNEIAYSCGFSTPTHFYSLFKSRYGLSPLRYKKSYENQQKSPEK